MTIGEFSRRSQLSLKALRLYERLGLLRPVAVDPGNGYRRYHESQLYTARLIIMLRLLDMPLSEVVTVVSASGAEAAELSTRTGTQRNGGSPRSGRLWPASGRA